MLRRVVQTRESQALRGLAHVTSSTRRAQARLLNVEFRPLFSAQMEMNGVLILVEDQTEELAAGRELEAMVTDKRLREAATPKELIDAGLRHATEIMPGAELLIQVVRGRTARDRDAAIGATSGWRLTKDRETVRLVTKIATQVASKRSPVELDATFGGRPFRITAVPLIARGRKGEDGKLGTVMWRRPPRRAARSDDQVMNSRLKAFASHFGLAVELLQLRIELARKEALLESASNAAAVIREPNAVGEGLAARFLERMAIAIDADAASLGRIEGNRFVLVASFRPTPAVPRVGHTFELMGGYVSEAVRTGKPTATSRLDTIQIQPAELKRDMMRMKYSVAVPLVRDVTVIGCIVLLRTSGPFTEDEVALVQMLSGIGVLSVTAGFGIKPARRPAG
jgi:GAF domain-containing protein